MEKTYDTSINLNLLDEKGVYEAFHVDGNEVEALTDSYFHGTYSGSDGNYTVTVKGNITSLQQEVVLKFSVSDDTEDSTKCVINSVTATINDNELDQNSTLD